MIARLWHGVVPAEKASEYQRYLRSVGFDEYAEFDGNRGAYLLQRADGEVTHFIMFSLWDSADAVKEYAGEDISVPRYTPVDRAFLLHPESSVEHFTVFSQVD